MRKPILTVEHTGARAGMAVRAAGAGLLLCLAFALGGCLGGASTETNPNAGAGAGGVAASYSGPAPATADVQAYRLYVWENLKDRGRCGQCHVQGGTAPVGFVRDDDINLAWQAANTIVDRSNPAQSPMVEKVRGGHNCWEASSDACADIIVGYLNQWLQGGAGAANQIQLVPPPVKEPGASKSFPDDAALFAQTVYPVIRSGASAARCERCHSESAATPQKPYFASGDIATAYEAAKPRMNLADPAGSRLVVRLRDEHHNCWSDCEADAQAVLAAILAFAGQIPATQVDPSLVLSKALTLTDGVVASGQSRYEADVIALYQFKTGSGGTVYDISGVNPAVNLALSGNVEWVGGWGIQIKAGDGALAAGKAQAMTDSSKLHDLIQATGEYSIEAWVVPGNVVQEEANIVSYSGASNLRNFTLGQTMYNYDFYSRDSVGNDPNGEPALSTDDGDEVLQATLQHVVATFHPSDGKRIYVNGELVASDPTPVSPQGWGSNYALVLGNEVDGQRLWEGTLRLVAIHNRALTESQIQQNYAAGVGERFYLLFNVGCLIEPADPGCQADPVEPPRHYVMIEASQFDSYAYLFNRPTFISLEPDFDAAVADIPIEGMRIGMNGREVEVGQAYASLSTTVTDGPDGYQPGAGQLLSPVGTVIALEKGPESDEFFLTFERIGDQTHAYVEADPPAPAVPEDLPAAPTIGLRTFDEINATMAQITGVSPQHSEIAATYALVKQQLPAVETVEGFLAAHQTGVAQLAIEYCDKLVDDPALRLEFFAPFTAFDLDVDSAFEGGVALPGVIDAIYDRVVGRDLADMPSREEVRQELGDLYGRLTAGCLSGCDAGRTRDILKSMCAATLGSAAMLIQ